MCDAVKRKMDNIFAEANTIQDEAIQVEKGQQYLEELEEAVKELPEEVLCEKMQGSSLTGETAATVELLAGAPAALRSHHNLFGQFQYKCVGLTDLVIRDGYLFSTEQCDHR